MHARIAALIIPVAFVLAVPSAHAQQDFYKGKTIRLIVGQAAGGGYDTYGRLLAPFLTQFLPGQPAVTVQNMPGAGSILMANYLYSQAPRDGTVIALGGGSIATAALFGATGARFDCAPLQLDRQHEQREGRRGRVAFSRRSRRRPICSSANSWSAAPA